MVNYSSYPVYASAKLVRTDSAARMSSVSTASSSTLPDAMWAASGLSGGAFHSDGGPASFSSSGGPNGGPSGGGNPADDYFQFNDEQQDALLQDARANAAALVVDVLADVDKWQFVATRGPVNVFELRSDAADRVSSMVPPPAAADAPVAFHSHTMLAMTRVRAKLDDFMRIMAAPTRDRFQDVQTCLYEDRVQLADVFTSFGGLSAADVRATPPPGNKPGRSGSSSSSSSSATATAGDGVDMEQFAVKYVSLKGATPKKRSGSSLSSSSSSIKLRRRKASTSKENDDEGLTFCLGEYATIRRGNVRGRSPAASPATLEDQRIGIIAQHSLEDPAVTKWCKPIMLNRDGGAFAVASRSLAQFSGMVVYPVASTVAGENLLEVLVKLSVYDPRPGGIPGPVRHNMLTYLTAFAHLENALLVMRLRASPYLTSRNWNRGGRGARKCCSLCQAGFSSFRRKHHCRLCGEVTCSKCSDVHQIKLGKAGKCPFRICAQCAHGTADALRLQRRSGGSHADEFDLPPQGDDDDDDDDEIENDTVNKPTTPVRGSKLIAKESGSELYDSRGLLASSVVSQRSNPSSSSTVSLTSSRSTATGHSMTTSTASSSRTASDPPAFLGVETASVTSSTASPLSPSSAVEDSDSFYQRFSEMSLMDFHDSEFDLSIKGMGIGAANGAGRPTGFEFDDSERGSDNELDDIGEEDEDICDYDVDAQLAAREIDIDAQPTIPIKTRTVSAHEVSIDDVDDDDDDESGMEFHDSEVGIEFDVSEVEVIGTSYGSAVLLEELEEIEDDVDEVIHTNSNQHRADLAYLDEQRAARLQAYAIMDSGKEMIYDVVAKQAAQHLGCALATISFVDASREFVKASFGVQMGGSEIPKQHSLTAHLMRRSVLEDVDVVVVSDARRDDLLSGNVFVYERPGVRFVAGVPVKSSDGVILGALLVADTQPRSELPAIHRSLLRDLAEQVAALLEDRLSRQPPPPTTGSKAGARPGQMREQLADLLSQSYHTGLQVQQNEQKLSSSFASSRIFSASSGAVFGTSGSLSASAFKPSPQLSQSAFDPNFSRIKPKFHTPANYQRNGIEL